MMIALFWCINVHWAHRHKHIHILQSCKAAEIIKLHQYISVILCLALIIQVTDQILWRLCRTNRAKFYIVRCAQTLSHSLSLTLRVLLQILNYSACFWVVGFTPSYSNSRQISVRPISRGSTMFSDIDMQTSGLWLTALKFHGTGNYFLFVCIKKLKHHTLCLLLNFASRSKGEDKSRYDNLLHTSKLPAAVNLFRPAWDTSR